MIQSTLNFLISIFVVSNLIGTSFSVLAANKITKRKVELEWEPQPGIANYEVEIYKKDQKTPIGTYKSSTNIFSTSLFLGEYEVRSRVISIQGEEGPWSSLEPLLVKVPKGALKQNENPLTNFHKTDLKTRKALVMLEWEDVPDIKGYKVEILVEKTQGTGVAKRQVAFTKIVNKSPLEVYLPGGEFRYTVTPFDSYGNSGEPSDESSPITVSTAKLPPPHLEPILKNEQLEALKWGVFPGARLVGNLYYKKILSEDVWVLVQKDLNINKMPWIIQGNLKPGDYELKLHAEAVGASSSEEKSVEFFVKPKKIDLKEIIPNYL